MGSQSQIQWRLLTRILLPLFFRFITKFRKFSTSPTSAPTPSSAGSKNTKPRTACKATLVTYFCKLVNFIGSRRLLDEPAITSQRERLIWRSFSASERKEKVQFCVFLFVYFKVLIELWTKKKNTFQNLRLLKHCYSISIELGTARDLVW